MARRTGTSLGGAGLVTVDLASGGTGRDVNPLPVDGQPGAVAGGSFGDDLAGVDHSGLDALGGDHHGAALRRTALDDGRPGGWGALRRVAS